MKYLIKLGLLSTCFFLFSCTSNQSVQDEGLKQCTEPRPEVCTMEYAPVCGTDNKGETQTYATGCTACADAQVVAYHEGECQ